MKSNQKLLNQEQIFFRQAYENFNCIKYGIKNNALLLRVIKYEYCYALLSFEHAILCSMLQTSTLCLEQA